MIIRKLFKFEMAHIVRRAWSQRCSKNIHWHSYEVEVFFEWNRDDDAWMLIDFWLVKELIWGFLDIFDHSTMLWSIEEDTDTCEFFLKKFERVIISPFPTSAEIQARFFTQVINKVFNEYCKENSIKWVKLSSVRVHETKTWYAEYFTKDLCEKDAVEIIVSEKNVEDIKNSNYVIISSWIWGWKWLNYYNINK